jgi:recombination protein RecA
MEDTKQQKSRSLELAIANVEKEFGKGSIMRLKEGETIGGDIAVVPTGSIGLDIALGIGGYPRGRIIEVYGPESSGKTTLTLHAIASVQRAGGTAAFIDAEHALDPTYARKLGVKTEELLISQPDYGEQALEIADMLVHSGAVDLVVIDSVAALVPKAEIEGDMGDSHVGLQARLMSQALRKLTGSVSRSNCIIFFTNQIRMKIGVMFGSPETTSGGNALKFYASMRLDVRRIGAIKEASPSIAGKDVAVVGNRTRVKVVKNKMAAPFREVEFDILYGQGISRSGEIIDMASDDGIIQKSGAWYSMEGERIGQGRDNARTYLDDHPDLLTSLETRVLAKHGIQRRVAQLGEPAQSDAAPSRSPAREPTTKTTSEIRPTQSATSKASNDARGAAPAKRASGK